MYFTRGECGSWGQDSLNGGITSGEHHVKANHWKRKRAGSGSQQKIVDAIAECDYAAIANIVDQLNSGWTTEDITEAIEGFKEGNDLTHFDPYDTPCSVNIIY